MPAASQTRKQPAKRRRRAPEEARAEILDAADALLRERPLHEMTVGEVMARTTLSRKAFYVYFTDIHGLVAELVRPLRSELDAANALWLIEAEDPLEGGREALLAVARILKRDGELLRALEQAAKQDEAAAEVWREFNDPVIEGVAAKLEREISEGTVTGLDARGTARALVGMNLHYLLGEVAGNPDADEEAVVEALLTIWARALYGRDPDPPS